jgi:hypothetical protein
MSHVELSLACEPSSVPRARRFVQAQLTTWDRQDLSWAAAVITSELASNCVLHARTDFTVVLDRQSSEVRLAVRDRSRAQPARRAAGSGSTTGRGLRLLDALARRWGVDQTSSGKQVWVELAAEADEPTEPGEPDLEQLMATFGEPAPEGMA